MVGAWMIRAVVWGNRYFSNPKRTIPAQWLLYLALWISAWINAFNGHGSEITNEGGAPVYTFWAIIAFGAPPIWIWTTWVVWKCTDTIWRWRALYARLAIDIGMLFRVSISFVMAFATDSDREIFHTCLGGFAIAFIALEVVRDAWVCVRLEATYRAVLDGSVRDHQ